MSKQTDPISTAALLPPDLVQLLADLPNNVDRRTGAALVTKHLSRYPIAPLRLGLCRHATSTAKPSWRPAHCSSMPSPCCRPPRSSSVVAGPSALGSVARRPPKCDATFHRRHGSARGCAVRLEQRRGARWRHDRPSILDAYVVDALPPEPLSTAVEPVSVAPRTFALTFGATPTQNNGKR